MSQEKPLMTKLTPEQFRALELWIMSATRVAVMPTFAHSDILTERRQEAFNHLVEPINLDTEDDT